MSLKNFTHEKPWLSFDVRYILYIVSMLYLAIKLKEILDIFLIINKL